MLQKLVKVFNSTKGSRFVSFTYTNKFGETSSRLIQINTIYENALKKDMDIVPNVEYVQNDKFDRATFITAQAEILKSLKMSLGIDDGTMNKVDKDKHSNRSNGQKDAYVQVAKNIKFNLEKEKLIIRAKDVRKTILVEGTYPTVNSRPKTIAKRFIQKQMKSSKYRNFILTELDSIKVNGDTIEFG